MRPRPGIYSRGYPLSPSSGLCLRPPFRRLRRRGEAPEYLTVLIYPMEKVDNLDRKILNIVMNNARIPSKDVAIVCGVSRAAIHQRIQRLIEMGVIVGSGYNVNPRKLGYNTCTSIGVSLEKGSMYRDVVKELEKIPEVVECHFTTGPYSMLIKVFAHNNQHLMELLNNNIQQIAGVTETETLISLEQSMNRQIQLDVDPDRLR